MYLIDLLYRLDDNFMHLMPSRKIDAEQMLELTYSDDECSR